MHLRLNLMEQSVIGVLVQGGKCNMWYSVGAVKCNFS